MGGEGVGVVSEWVVVGRGRDDFIVCGVLGVDTVLLLFGGF